MTTITALRTGLATRLATISGLRTLNYVPDQINPPVAVVLPSSISYDTTFVRAADEYRFDVVVIVARADEETAQKYLDAYCASSGAGSVKAAVEGDVTLGGAAQTTRVTDLMSYQVLAVGETQYLAATFSVSIIA